MNKKKRGVNIYLTGYMARKKVTKAEWEELNSYDETWTHDISGWSAGPVARARWYFADGALALAPEVYFRYTSLTYEDTYEYPNGDRETDTIEFDISQMDTEYSLALEFYF